LLARVSGHDLAVGRLVEGHLDALAILDELGRGPAGPGLYGVWAAHRPGELVAVEDRGGWRLEGSKPFCSGAGGLARALVVADAPDGVRLFDLDVSAVDVIEDTWPAVGMAGSASSAVRWSDEPVGSDQAVGAPGAYTDRLGFWWGAAGVAACWWGGGRSIVEVVRRSVNAGSVGEVELAALGSAWAHAATAESALRDAAATIDSEMGRSMASARMSARVCRHIVHEACVAILASTAAAGGARVICLDAAQSRRTADLYAYLAQHHPGRDAAALGRSLIEER
jgi:alkylation response protein AidB-like acyl-CoA dehydrogenase